MGNKNVLQGILRKTSGESCSVTHEKATSHFTVIIETLSLSLIRKGRNIYFPLSIFLITLHCNKTGKTTYTQFIKCSICFFIYLSLWVMASTGPGEELSGVTISAAVGAGSEDVIVWSCSGGLLRFLTGSPEWGSVVTSACEETRKRCVLFQRQECNSWFITEYEFTSNPRVHEMDILTLTLDTVKKQLKQLRFLYFR